MRTPYIEDDTPMKQAEWGEGQNSNALLWAITTVLINIKAKVIQDMHEHRCLPDAGGKVAPWLHDCTRA